MQMSRKQIGVVAISAVAVLAVAAASMRLFSSPSHNLPDPATIRPEEAPEIFTSDEYRSLSRQQRRDYAEKAMTAFIVNTAADYCALDADQREAYIDNLIMMMEIGGRQFGGDGQERHRHRGPGPSPEEVRRFSERVDSTSRAQIIQFTADFQRRLQQRQDR